MSGYNPIFDSIFTGTLSGKWPDIGVWSCLVGMKDKHGHIDCTPQYLARVLGLDVNALLECIDRFMQPDPYSRSRDCDGRRLELIDPSRPWGWKVVNHHKYREKARLSAKSEREITSGENRERMGDRRGPPETAADPLSEQSKAITPIPPDFGFAEFWTAYPKKIRKAAAMRAWLRKALSAKSGEILSHLEQRVRSDAQWLAEAGKYIPHPATWLNGDGWLDEYQREAPRNYL